MAALGVVLMCEILHDIFARKVHLLLPGDGNNDVDCLRSPDFLRIARDIADVEGCAASGYGSDISLVRRIDSDNDIRRFILTLDELRDVWSNNCDLVTTGSELCQNALQHSNKQDEDAHGYLAMQVYGGVLQFAVADPGMGIHASLRDTPQRKAMSDIDVLREACEPGISSKGGHRGMGLSRTVDIVRKARGYINICSGNASIILFGYDGDVGVQRREQYGDEDISGSPGIFRGTQVGILIPRIDGKESKG
jgi:hypothetical protein